MSEPRSGRVPAGGFTLLEVLVAVALLGIVVSVLARTAIEGMSYEGDAMRRTRASLIADRLLFGIESGLRLGPPKPLHEESSEEDEYQVTLDVVPLELGPNGLEALLPPPEPGRAGSIAARNSPAQAAAVPGLALFRILVRVAWIEGLREQAVTRTSFAYDATAAAALLAEGEAGEATAPPPEEPAPEPEEEVP